MKETPPAYNLERRRIEMLRQIKTERRWIIMYTDNGLGPAIMEITRYNQRVLSDHLDNPINYRGLDETEAILINESTRRITAGSVNDSSTIQSQTLSPKTKGCFSSDHSAACEAKKTASSTWIFLSKPTSLFLSIGTTQ